MGPYGYGNSAFQPGYGMYGTDGGYPGYGMGYGAGGGGGGGGGNGYGFLNPLAGASNYGYGAPFNPYVNQQQQQRSLYNSQPFDQFDD